MGLLSFLVTTLALSPCRVGQKEGDHTFEPYFNGALLAFKTGDFQESFDLVSKALSAYPEHTESLDLLKQLKSHFSLL